MTTPAPAPQPQQAATAAADAELATAVATALVSAVTVAAATAMVASVFRWHGISRQAAGLALDVVMGMPPSATGFYGPATAAVARLNLMRRAQFVVHSARRVQGDLATARAHGTPPLAALREAASRERRYYGQHLAAIWNREIAASQVDSASMTYGDLLGWYTVLDSRTSPECRAADRRNFLASQMPAIGYPGMVHPHCRCRPGPPHPGAALLAGSGRRYAAAS